MYGNHFPSTWLWSLWMQGSTLPHFHNPQSLTQHAVLKTAGLIHMSSSWIRVTVEFRYKGKSPGFCRSSGVGKSYTLGSPRRLGSRLAYAFVSLRKCTLNLDLASPETFTEFSQWPLLSTFSDIREQRQGCPVDIREQYPHLGCLYQKDQATWPWNAVEDGPLMICS